MFQVKNWTQKIKYAEELGFKSVVSPKASALVFYQEILIICRNIINKQ
jgi:predicted ATP-dependent serine protease